MLSNGIYAINAINAIKRYQTLSNAINAIKRYQMISNAISPPQELEASGVEAGEYAEGGPGEGGDRVVDSEQGQVGLAKTLRVGRGDHSDHTPQEDNCGEEAAAQHHTPMPPQRAGVARNESAPQAQHSAESRGEEADHPLSSNWWRTEFTTAHTQNSTEAASRAQLSWSNSLLNWSASLIAVLYLCWYDWVRVGDVIGK